MDMSKLNKDSPAQARERLQWQLDTVRANQVHVRSILQCFELGEPRAARVLLDELHGMDRDAILQSGGVLTDEQIELLT